MFNSVLDRVVSVLFIVVFDCIVYVKNSKMYSTANAHAVFSIQTVKFRTRLLCGHHGEDLSRVVLLFVFDFFS